MPSDIGHNNRAFVVDDEKGIQMKDPTKNFVMEMQEKKEIEYDPYKHRKVEHPTT